MSGHVINAPNISIAWLRATQHILNSGGECSNLLVTIENPLNIERTIHEDYENLISRHDLLTLKQVSYTIFPHSLYLQVGRDANKLFKAYNREHGVYERLQSLHRRKMRWGSYFRRMTYYLVGTRSGQPIIVNQLGDIISMLKKRKRVYKSAYTISIQIPGVDGRYIMGSPCLNYIALQLESSARVLNMLAVYRNHDFIERAYGNYLGLGNLMEFLCDQTGLTLGVFNCLSSHAYIKNLAGKQSWPSVQDLLRFLREYDTDENVQTPAGR